MCCTAIKHTQRQYNHYYNYHYIRCQQAKPFAKKPSPERKCASEGKWTNSKRTKSFAYKTNT